MTVRSRRLYYTLAIIIFLILAPIVLALAQGYQWSGWRLGFVPTGVLVVSTTLRATISINGREEAVTTKLTKRLRPGQYEISLSRSGYGRWTTLVSIKPNAAYVIGPVTLFPTKLPTTYQGPSVAVVVNDPVRHLVIGAQAESAGWLLRQLWPTGATWTAALVGQPRTVRFSPKQRLLVTTAAHHTSITSPGATESAWLIDPVEGVFWADQGDAVLYGLRGQQLLRIDSLARTQTLLARRSSAGWFSHQVWSTESSDGQTLLYRQAPEALEPILVRDFVGPWLIEPGLDGTLVLRNQRDHQTILYTARDQAEPLALGVVDQLWWPERGIPPLWQSGTQLYTLDEANQPLLLERGPENYQAVYWLVPQHILVSQADKQLTIRSVSARQGRGIILQQQLSAPADLLDVDRGRKVLLLQTSGSPTSIYTLGWE